MRPSKNSVRAWYLDPLNISPVKGEGFVGAVNQGGSVNFRNIEFNPHGHGTHTECLGHITPEVYSVNEHIRQFFFLAELISIEPETESSDRVITLEQYNDARKYKKVEAVIFRTLPNSEEKRTKEYSNSNPPYISWEVAKSMREEGIKHLLIDTPSVDREEDEGKLLAHHAFWNVPDNPRMDCSITELIYVPNDVPDGLYLLNLGFASFENDASPSKPLLFRIEK
jgi:kynurenine formamidase